MEQIFTNCRAVVFDLDGTLLHTLPDLAAACNHTRAQLGLSAMPDAWYMPKIGNGARKLITRMLPQTPEGQSQAEKAYALFCEYYNAHTSVLTRPFDGIPDALAALRAHGLRLAVVSNKPHLAAQTVTAHYFGNIFTVVNGNRDGFAVKPDPALLLDTLRQLDAAPDECLYIGDSDVDVYTARNAGTRCAAAAWGYRSEDELLRAGAGCLLHSPAQITSLLGF